MQDRRDHQHNDARRTSHGDSAGPVFSSPAVYSNGGDADKNSPYYKVSIVNNVDGSNTPFLHPQPYCTIQLKKKNNLLNVVVQIISLLSTGTVPGRTTSLRLII